MKKREETLLTPQKTGSKYNIGVPWQRGPIRQTKVRCVQPSASWVKCCICKKRIKTCERKKSVKGDYRCPAHPDGAQLNNGKWVCSRKCWETAAERSEK